MSGELAEWVALDQAISGAIPDDLPGYRQRYTERAIDAILAAGFHLTPTPQVVETRLPVVAYKGPFDTDVSMFRRAAKNLRGGYSLGGSNLTEAVCRLIDAAVERTEHPTPDAFYELTEAIRLTVEYVGMDTLPPIEGWSWYDALVKYAPDVAEHFVEWTSAHPTPDVDVLAEPRFIPLGDGVYQVNGARINPSTGKYIIMEPPPSDVLTEVRAFVEEVRTIADAQPTTAEHVILRLYNALARLDREAER